MFQFMRQKQHLGLGILFILLAGISYSMTSVFVKLSSSMVEVNVLIFLRYSFCLLCVLPFICVNTDLLKTSHLHLHLIRGTFGLLAIGSFFYSVKYLSLTTTTLLSTTTPLFVPLILRIFRKVKIVPKLYWGISIGLMGIVLILNPTREGLSLAGLVALSASVFRAIAITTIRTLAQRESPFTIMFYYFFVGTVIMGLSVIFDRPHSVEWPWLSILWIGVFSIGYQIFMTLSFGRAPARILTPFTYLSVGYSALADWLVWNHILSFGSIIGFALVLLGAVVTVYFGKEIIVR